MFIPQRFVHIEQLSRCNVAAESDCPRPAGLREYFGTAVDFAHLASSQNAFALAC